VRFQGFVTPDHVLAVALLAATVAAGLAWLAAAHTGAGSRGVPAPLFFFLGLGALLTAATWRSLVPLNVDTDTLTHAVSLSAADNLEEVVRLRGPWTADYLIQGPVIHLLRQIAGLPPLESYRLLTVSAAAVSAILLRRVGLLLGASEGMSGLYALLPLAAFGTGWLTSTLDDNAVSAALEWSFIACWLTLVLGPCGRRDRDALLCGALLGIAVSFHRKAWLSGVLLVAPLLINELRKRSVLRSALIALAAAAVAHALMLVSFQPEGISVALLSGLRSRHHAVPGWWFFSREGWDVLHQLELAWVGLRTALTTLPVVEDLSLGHSFALTGVAAVSLASLVAGIWSARGNAGCRILLVGLAVQVLHSVFYEPWSPERWDMFVAMAAPIAAVAASGRRSRSPWRFVACWIWCLLLATQLFSQWLFVETVGFGRHWRPDVDGGQVLDTHYAYDAPLWDLAGQLDALVEDRGAIVGPHELGDSSLLSERFVAYAIYRSGAFRRSYGVATREKVRSALEKGSPLYLVRKFSYVGPEIAIRGAPRFRRSAVRLPVPYRVDRLIPGGSRGTGR